MRKNKLILLFSAFFIVSFFLAFEYSQAQSSSQVNSNSAALTGGEIDAIGVRIIPNPSHYSIKRWYESQGFSGSPQALTVDGYEAIRDGRTVYVNAANIDPNSSPKKIYTNIYLISYNQSSAAKTVDILGQIVSHWKFNSNIIENTNPVPSCSISLKYCAGNQNCNQDQVSKNCLNDSDCPANFFCDSLKAKITRDLKRIGKLEELKEALFLYKKNNGHFPLLAAGSYLTNHTVSVWPSWTQEFLPALAVTQNFIDPINRLGYCSGYEQETCWNKETKKFIYSPTPAYLMLPADSYALVYKTDDAGSDYSLCAVMETRATPLNYEFSPNNPASSVCVTATGIISGGQATNTAPILIDKYLNGEAGREFNGFIKVIDQESNPLTWTLNTAGTNWTGWSQPPILQETNNLQQKKIYAARAGNVGDYSATLTVSDGQGGVLTTTTPLKITNPAPFIEASDEEYVLDPKTNFLYSFSFFDNNLTTPNSAYQVTRVSGPYNIFNGLTKTISSVGINKYKVSYSGLIATSSKFFKDTNIVYKVIVTDDYGAVAVKNFTIKLLVEDPQLNFSCSTNARLNKDYNCYLGSGEQGNHSLSYASNALPAGLALVGINTANEEQEEGGGAAVSRLESGPIKIAKKILKNFYNFFTRTNSVLGAVNQPPIEQPLNVYDRVYLKGKPTATSTGYKITIKAINEYSASSTREFVLKISDFCGDGKKQLPNLEGRGGFYNDGYEDCDGNDGVTSVPGNSSAEVQYGCATGVGTSTPNPIPNNSYCIFKDPLNGGGYCGDTYCQIYPENSGNCPADCAQPCAPDCLNKSCGSDGCGGSCGSCRSGDSCNPAGQCVTDCVPNCTKKDCGSDGCGGSCGSCPSGKTCNSSGKCVNSCSPDCSAKSCGSDGCGGSCGTCTWPKQCMANGVCCTADCLSCVGALSSYSGQPCGGSCCNNNTQVCCGTQCKANDWVPCGNTCCQPGKHCCAYTHVCVANIQQCNAGHE